MGINFWKFYVVYLRGTLALIDYIVISHLKKKKVKFDHKNLKSGKILVLPYFLGISFIYLNLREVHNVILFALRVRKMP